MNTALQLLKKYCLGEANKFDVYQKYFQEERDHQALNNLLTYLTKYDFKGWGNELINQSTLINKVAQDLSLYLKLDLKKLKNKEDLFYSMELSQRFIRDFLWNTLEVVAKSDYEIFKNCIAIMKSSICKVSQIEGIPLLSLQEMTGIETLEKNLLTSINYVEKQDYFFIWKGEERELERLADVLKSDYQYIKSKTDFKKFCNNVNGEKIEVLWNEDFIKELAYLIYRLHNSGLIKKNKGKGHFLLFQHAFFDFSKNPLQKELRKISSEVKKNSDANALIINNIEGVFSAAKISVKSLTF